MRLAAAFLAVVNCSDWFRAAQILFPVDLDATVGADIFGVFVELVDLIIECSCLQLTHM